jgi:NADH-quinone oxidoreductase subunit E
MAGETDKNATDKTTEKPSVGFTLPFAERAPTNPMDVMAAATAAGFALSTQFASAFFGMMQAAMEATAKPAQAPADKPVAEKPKAETPAPAAAPVAEKLVEASAAPALTEAPVQRVKAAKPAAQKVKAAKPAAKAPAKPVPTAAEKPATAKAKTARGKVAVAETKPVEPKARPAAAKRGKAGADLKQISGIGPKLEGLLNGMGVKSVKDIAGWTEEDVVHFDRELGLDGRIAKDNWIAQAKTLLR